MNENHFFIKSLKRNTYLKQLALISHCKHYNFSTKVSESKSCFASLLTPQGKFLFEFIVAKHKSGFFIDCEKNQSDEILKQLNLTPPKDNLKNYIYHFSNQLFTTDLKELEKEFIKNNNLKQEYNLVDNTEIMLA